MDILKKEHEEVERSGNEWRWKKHKSVTFRGSSWYRHSQQVGSHAIDFIHPIEIKRTASPGTELIRPFKLLDKASVPRGKGAIICMKETLSAVDSDNYIVPIWMI